MRTSQSVGGTSTSASSHGWTKPIPGYAGHRTFGWNRLDSSYAGPHDAPAPKTFVPHIVGYCGVAPRSWCPPGQHQPTARGHALLAGAGIHSLERSSSVGDARGSRRGLPRQVHLQGYAGHRPVNWTRSKELSVALTHLNGHVALNSFKGDGFGSVRLATPTMEERAAKRAQFVSSLGFGARSAAMPLAKNTPCARFGYMPPNPSSSLSQALTRKIAQLFVAMDTNNDSLLTKDEAKAFFRRFPKANTDAMFSEVDTDDDCVITLDEFYTFWNQVKASGYSEVDIDSELTELIGGSAWVDWQDTTRAKSPREMSKRCGE